MVCDLTIPDIEVKEHCVYMISLEKNSVGVGFWWRIRWVSGLWWEGLVSHSRG